MRPKVTYVQSRGHAIEVRIYPEDPETFLPHTGTIKELHLPAEEHIRIDSAIFPGYEVVLDYEPLMAKVMAWGESREEAVKRLQRALLALRLDGVKCNVPLLRDILSTPEFTSGSYHTGSLPIWMKARCQREPHLPVNGTVAANGHEKSGREIAAAIGAALALALKGAQSPGSLAPAGSPWRAYGRREQLLART